MPRGVPGSGKAKTARKRATTTQAMGVKGGSAGTATTTRAVKKSATTGGSRARGTSAASSSSGGGALGRMTAINATQRNLFISLEGLYTHAQGCLENFRHYQAINAQIAAGWLEDYNATWTQIQKLAPQLNVVMRQQQTSLRQQVTQISQLQFA